jgi:hypothetical protein
MPPPVIQRPPAVAPTVPGNPPGQVVPPPIDALPPPQGLPVPANSPVGPLTIVPEGPVGKVPDEPLPPNRHMHGWPMVWGDFQFDGFATGDRMAPNGELFNPLFLITLELDMSILPDKQLYLFSNQGFWGQKAAKGVTNPTQGSLVYSKREYDLTLGLAWTYYDSLELRVYGWAFNNLNRGNSLTLPYGYNDGVGIENRYYFPCDDKYDIGRQAFVALGYLPSKSLTGADGNQFNTGAFARAYLTYDLPYHTYVYFDGQYFGEHGVKPRLLTLDAGVAIRPFVTLQNMEFRIGGMDTYDCLLGFSRSLGYGAFRVQF